MIEISTSFQPYRMVLYRKAPVELRVKIKNAGTESALISYRLLLPAELSLDKTGLSGQHSEKLGEVKPGETAEQIFDIYARPLANQGNAEIKISATEHYNNYEFSMKEYKKKVGLVIS